MCAAERLCSPGAKDAFYGRVNRPNGDDRPNGRKSGRNAVSRGYLKLTNPLFDINASPEQRADHSIPAINHGPETRVVVSP